MLETIAEESGPRIVVCCGSGGVGKTTVAATLGLTGALGGRRTLVLTIDPARRLADSLGLAGMEHEAQQVSRETLTALGFDPPGELHAMMLDTKRTFDHLIEKYASGRARENILQNRYYQHISTTLAGSHEYMAMEKLFEIHSQGAYDLIVLDTPPSRRALDFLEAPKRLTNLLGHNLFFRIFKPYLHAGRLGFRMVSTLAAPFLKATRQMMGGQILDDIGDFLRLWDDVLFEGFRQRAGAVRELLSSPETLFLGITSPRRPSMSEALYLYKKLKEYRMPFGGFVVNRVHPVYPSDGPAQLEGLSEVEPALREKLVANFRKFQRLGESDAQAVRLLREKVGHYVDVRKVPYFEFDVHDLGGLYKVMQQLFPSFAG